MGGRSRHRLAPRTPRALLWLPAGALLLGDGAALAQDAPKVEAPKLEAPKLEAPKAPDPGKAPDPTKPPAKKDAPADASKSGTAPVSDAPGVPRDIEVVLLGEKPRAAQGGVPTAVPRELQRDVPAGSGLTVEDKKGAALTIEEVVNPPIYAASKRKEGLLSAPAWGLVLTARDIRARGYTELSQTLDDLPAMDVVRPFGDYYVKSYIRGQRTLNTDTHLLMIDGVVMNDLLFNSADIYAALPLTNIDHIEIIYGPGSAIFGPNASTGIINVVTRDGSAQAALGEYGAFFSSNVTFGGTEAAFSEFDTTTKIVDATAMYVSKEYRLRLSARFEHGALDPAVADYFEYTKSSYYSRKDLWGDLSTTQTGLPGKFFSRDLKLGVDARAFFGQGTEIGGQVLAMSTGSGTAYPADRFQQLPWERREINVYARHRANLSPRAQSTTLVQLRSSDVLPSAGYARVLDSATGQYGLEYTTTEAPNLGIILTQDFAIGELQSLVFAGDSLSFGAGIQYQHLEFNALRSPTCRRFADVTSTEATDCVVTSLLRGDEARPAVPRDNAGAYVTARYGLTPDHAFHAGVRGDFSSLREQPGATFRGGYVGTLADMVTLKALYGQAVYEPGGIETARTHYDSKAVLLEDERSQTGEVNADLKLSWLALHAGGYIVYVDNPQTAAPSSKVTNLHSRTVSGVDLGVQLLYKPLQVWAYYSQLLLAEEVPTEGDEPRAVGDLAYQKLWGGVTFDYAPVTATVLGRLAGPRDPVTTNPTGRIPLQGTIDAHVMLSDVPVRGLHFGIRITNLLDSRYHHPGISFADSGDTAGVTDAAGVYSGSAGNYNSRLPQPGRAFFGTIGLTLEPGKTQSP